MLQVPNRVDRLGALLHEYDLAVELLALHVGRGETFDAKANADRGLGAIPANG